MTPNVITLTDDEMGLLLAILRNTVRDIDIPTVKQHVSNLHNTILEQRREEDGMEVC